MGQPGRPRKAADKRLQPVSTSVEPDVYATLQRIAARRRLKVSDVVRRIIAGRLGGISQSNNYESGPRLLP